MEHQSSKSFPDFFKVYLPARNSQILHIPNNYEAKCGRFLPKKIRLWNDQGKCWLVDVARTDKGVYFLNGWQKFAQHNSFVCGDFLSFRFDGNHSFYVKNLGQHDADSSATGANEMTNCSEVNDLDIDRHHVSDGNKEGEFTEVNENTDEDEDDDYDIDYNDEQTSKKKRNWNDDIQGSQKRSGFEEEVTAIVSCNIEPKKMSDNKGGAKMISVAEASNSKSTPVRNPQFIGKLRTGSRKHLLLIPLLFIKRHKLELPELMVFQNENGNEWPGRTLYWSDGRTWITGWDAFCKWNNVSQDDCCVCEFLPGFNGQKGDTIKVHIIRNAGAGS